MKDNIFIIMVKLINILKEIKVADPTPFHRILKAYIDLVKKETNPDLSPDYEELADYMSSISVPSVKDIEQLASSIKTIHNKMNELLGEYSNAYYKDDLRPTIQDICKTLNVPFQLVKDLINELDKLFKYNEKI